MDSYEYRSTEPHMSLSSPIRLLVYTLMIGIISGCSNNQTITDNQNTKAEATITQKDVRSTKTGQTAKAVTGKAAWYGPGYYGRKTTSGDILKKGTLTAAHSSLEMGTKVRVTRLDNNKIVIVEINDRKPYKEGVVIDLAHGAAQALGIDDEGKVTVKVEEINE